MEKGKKVICIDDSIPARIDIEEFKKDFTNWVKKDDVYTIREILHNDGITTSVLLEELKNPVRFFPKTIGRSQESSFRITRFREMEAAEMVQDSFENLTETEMDELSKEFEESEKANQYNY